VSPAEVARASTEVPVPPERAFALFTEQIDAWWLRDARYRAPDHGRVYFEGTAGGRLLVERRSGPPFEMGRVLEWAPGERLRLEWRAEGFGEAWTRVEVRFEPTPRGTRVAVEHSGFEELAAEHPARGGLAGEALQARWGVAWADLLVSLQRRAREAARAGPAS